jgi:hypothetical protein
VRKLDTDSEEESTSPAFEYHSAPQIIQNPWRDWETENAWTSEPGRRHEADLARTNINTLKSMKVIKTLASRFVTRLAIFGLIGLIPTAGLLTAQAAVGANASKQLGSVKNEVASTLLPGTRYNNIVNIGCGWASGVNFTSSYDWPSLLPAIMSDPAHVYDILTSPQNLTRYQNRYAVLIKQALEARDGTSINLFDVAKTGHTSPYGQFEINDLDAIIADQFGGKLSGNTLVLYEYGPPDFIRLVTMLYDRDSALNPVATSFGGEPLPPGAALFGDSYWQARFIGMQGGDTSIQNRVLQRYAGHFLPTQTGAVPYVDETDVLGPPYSNNLTVSDRFFASYARDYKRLLGNDNRKYGNKVDIIAIGNENPYEGGRNFRQYRNSVLANNAAVYPGTLFPTFFGCRPDTIGSAQLGIDDAFVHPFARKLEELAFDYTNKMLEQARENGVSVINAYNLFAGHHSRFDDPTSPYYVAADPTYWAYMAEINGMGHEVIADVMLHILNTGKGVYARKHSDTFRQRALQNEFPGVFGY